MKTQIPPGRTLALALIVLALFAESSRASLFNDSFTNTAGTGVWETDSNWSTTTYPSNGHTRPDPSGNPIPGPNPTYNAILSIAAPCTLSIGVTVESVTIATGSTLNLSSNGSLKLNGPLSNSGVISVNGIPNAAEMVLSNASRIEPGGVLAIGTGGNAVYAINHGDTLTIAPGATVHGAGQMNVGFFGDTRHLLELHQSRPDPGRSAWRLPQHRCV